MPKIDYAKKMQDRMARTVRESRRPDLAQCYVIWNFPSLAADEDIPRNARYQVGKRLGIYPLSSKAPWSGAELLLASEYRRTVANRSRRPKPYADWLYEFAVDLEGDGEPIYELVQTIACHVDARLQSKLSPD